MSDPIESASGVTGAPAADKPASAPEQRSGLDDVADLIGQYDTDTKADAESASHGMGGAEAEAGHTADEPDGLPPIDEHGALLGYARALGDMAKEIRRERDTRDTSAAIEAIRGDVSAEIYPDSMVAGWVTDQAKADPKVQAAWINRYKEPRAYDAAVAKLSRAFWKERGRQLDDYAAAKGEQENRAAVNAFMLRSSTARPPEMSDRDYGRKLSGMSDGDFEKEKSKLMGA